MRIVAALGGNALLRRGQRAEHTLQQQNVRRAVRALAPLATEYELVVVHGNGPQVGMLALESAADRDLDQPYPLDVLVAETQGMIGYWLAEALSAALPGREVVTLVTRTVVDGNDPAFARPVKFIGPGYGETAAGTLAADRGWTLRRDGRRWRRVVPSPEPVAVVERPVIARLAAEGVVVVAGGGGGVPVAAGDDGTLRGVEAVVDKDLTAALLAGELKADALLLLTDVPAVLRGFGTAHPEPIARASVAQLRALGLPEGSMAPKVDACGRFLAAGGSLAAIGALHEAGAILAGTAGTRVDP
ncbi:carbamate kinase [Prauserella muralis]|uniref:Carbamate kinase n=1 Tax=Prauserella muralis TaxID=588067 RepID=A0A2V4AHM6_9PSEU|nr:carbamate kinase [Prauserella muralis]PXY19415.1 carbamate kinase [Prauserella muralis]TWE29389.1 carbamate kinase [Prauserella muralis]